MAPRPSTKMPKIESLSDLEESLNLLVYGDSGVGKTVFAGSADNGLIIASDLGTMSASRMGSKAKRVRINTWEDFEETQKWLRAGGYEDFSWIIVDGLTMLWEKAMVYVLQQVVLENDKRDPYIPAPADHQKVHMMLKRTVEIFCSLEVDTLFTALPMNVETQDGDEIVVPQIKGQKGDVSQYIAGLMTSYGHMSVKTLTNSKTGREREVRRITWKPTGAYTGKDRSGVLAPYTDDITLDEIRTRITESAKTSRRATGSARRSTTRTGTRRAGTRTRRTA